MVRREEIEPVKHVEPGVDVEVPVFVVHRLQEEDGEERHNPDVPARHRRQTDDEDAEQQAAEAEEEILVHPDVEICLQVHQQQRKYRQIEVHIHELPVDFCQQPLLFVEQRPLPEGRIRNGGYSCGDQKEHHTAYAQRLSRADLVPEVQQQQRHGSQDMEFRQKGCRQQSGHLPEMERAAPEKERDRAEQQACGDDVQLSMHIRRIEDHRRTEIEDADVLAPMRIELHQEIHAEVVEQQERQLEEHALEEKMSRRHRRGEPADALDEKHQRRIGKGHEGVRR